jgi:hypothetical protein
MLLMSLVLPLLVVLMLVVPVTSRRVEGVRAGVLGSGGRDVAVLAVCIVAGDVLRLR